MATKIKINPILNDGDYKDKVKKYLDEMMDKGLALKSFGQLHWNFEETDNKYKYLIEEKYLKSKEELDDYISMYESYGYEYIGKEEFAYIFRIPGDTVYEVHETSIEEKKDVAYTKYVRYSRMAVGLFALALALFYTGNQFIKTNWYEMISLFGFVAGCGGFATFFVAESSIKNQGI